MQLTLPPRGAGCIALHGCTHVCRRVLCRSHAHVRVYTHHACLLITSHHITSRATMPLPVPLLPQVLKLQKAQERSAEAAPKKKKTGKK